MKILMFEYITSGGFCQPALIPALSKEALLMLNALYRDLTALPDTEVLVLLDEQFASVLPVKANAQTLIRCGDEDWRSAYWRAIRQCSAVWPIAPEFDGILENVCADVQRLRKILLNSPAHAVALTANKWTTYQRLLDFNVPTVETHRLDHFHYNGRGEWIVKAIDGAGCSDSQIINDSHDFEQLPLPAQRLIIQPLIHGKTMSLSALFRQGKGYLMSVNQQFFHVVNKRFQLDSIEVNCQYDTARYQILLDKIAYAMPELFGYVGIDLIETPTDCYVLEINPRVTTAYAGIYSATLINVAEQVLCALSHAPDLTPACQQTITLNI